MQINRIRVKRRSPTPDQQTGANKFNKKGLKRENQFKKKESCLSLSVSDEHHSPQQNAKTLRLREKREREVQCKIP